MKREQREPEQLELEDAIEVGRDGELVKAKLNAKGRRQDDRGRELPDPVPLAPPVGYRPGPDIFQQVRDLVRSERLAAEAAASGAETFEEAEDFAVGDDFDPSSPYEDIFEGLTVREMDERIAELTALRNDRAAGEAPAPLPMPPTTKAGASGAPKGSKKAPKPAALRGTVPAEPEDGGDE